MGVATTKSVAGWRCALREAVIVTMMTIEYGDQV
jgi:hypothetical protein